MVYKANNLPAVNEIGQILETEGAVKFGKRAYNQTDGNCFEIAARLAELFGCQPLKSKKELADLIFSKKEEWAFGNPSSPRFRHKSPVCLVIREPESLNMFGDDVHVTLEAYGREYNYGPGTREEFLVEMRIPLYLQSR